MLKIETIEFIDSKNRNYSIKNYQIESFPLIGGEEANVITTKVWNQHGNTFVNSYMESFDGELIFTLHQANLSELEITDQRKEVTNICNPLNGIIKMKVTLNSGKVFNRDITFTSAPLFPIGIENRNDIWQKVQLLYEANSPFWYAEEEIIESFQGSDPLFQFPFDMSLTDPVIFGNVISNKIAINEGQVEAPVVIEIKGACVNPRIDNETTNEFIAFKDLTMTANDTLIIDTTFGQKKVELNGVNVFNKLDFSSTFFNLIIGENSIDFTDETASTTATILFIYKNLYITI